MLPSACVTRPWPRRARPLVALICLLGLALAAACADDPARAEQRLTVDYERPISQIAYPFWGINYVAFWDPIAGSPASLHALRHTGVQVLRFPGGEPANWLDWSKPAEPPYWSSTSTDELGAYARAIGAQLMLQTNPTSNRVSDAGELNDPSAERAAAWVAYTKEAGIAAPFWEIGNEPDLKLTAADDWAAMEWYSEAFNAQAAAMRAANPQIAVLGPAGTNVYQWWGLRSLDMFLARTGNRQGTGMVDGVSLHFYPTQGCAGWEAVRAAGQSWQPNMDHIREVIATYDTRPLPVFISETNAAVGALNCEINQTMAAALANADLLGAFRASGVQAVQLFGTIHAANGWGLLYGADEGRPPDTPTPTFFILPIWAESGSEVLAVNGLRDPATTLSAYASRRGDGSAQVVLINKTGAPLHVQVAVAGQDLSGRTAEVYELRPAHGEVSDKDVIYNGVLMPDVSAPRLPPPAPLLISARELSRVLPAYSLTLVDLGAP